MLRIVKYPHPALRYESVPVSRIDDELRGHVRAMFELMYEHRGIGLAANQVGLPLRLFILNVTSDRNQPEREQVFINPEIVKRHSSVHEEEGCLSFPGLYGHVQRAKRIRIKAFDLDGNDVEVEADDLLGRALQHETDHLSGRLFIDTFDPKTLATSQAALKEFEAEYLRGQGAGEIPPDDQIRRDLAALAARARA